MLRRKEVSKTLEFIPLIFIVFFVVFIVIPVVRGIKAAKSKVTGEKKKSAGAPGTDGAAPVQTDEYNASRNVSAQAYGMQSGIAGNNGNSAAGMAYTENSHEIRNGMNQSYSAEASQNGSYTVQAPYTAKTSHSIPYTAKTPPQSGPYAVKTPQNEPYAVKTPQNEPYAVKTPQNEPYAVNAAAKKGSGANGLSRAMQDLSPAACGVIWAEIIGEPKALQ